MGHDDTVGGMAEEHRLNYTHQRCHIGISLGLIKASDIAMKKAVDFFQSDSREADSFKAFSKELKRLAEEVRRKAEA